MTPPRVLIVDDHPVMRDGLRRSLEAFDVDVIAGVADGRAAVAAVERLRPEAVVMDISMPSMDGISATEIIRSRHPEVAVVVLTFNGDEDVHRRALEAGASVVITKDAPAEDVVAVLREVLAGDPVGERRSERPRLDGELSLTSREIEILSLITKGASTTRVGTELYISVKTVKNHLASIYDKLDVTDRTQAVLSALRLGLVSLDS
jgi:DNA-binding NarL/FixJ family response regulator